MDVRSKLYGRDSFFVAGDKVHGNEPLTEGYLRVLEDSTNKDGEILTAVRTAEGTILTSIAMVFSTERTDNILLVPTGLKDSLATLVLSGKVVGEFEYGIKSAEVNHKAQVLRFLITYTLNLGFSYKKSRLFYL
jgi:hypothetical protein